MKSIMMIEADTNTVIMLRRLIVQAGVEHDLTHRNFIWHEGRPNHHMGDAQMYDKLSILLEQAADAAKKRAEEIAEEKRLSDEAPGGD